MLLLCTARAFLKVTVQHTRSTDWAITKAALNGILGVCCAAALSAAFSAPTVSKFCANLLKCVNVWDCLLSVLVVLQALSFFVRVERESPCWMKYGNTKVVLSFFLFGSLRCVWYPCVGVVPRLSVCWSRSNIASDQSHFYDAIVLGCG